MNDTYVQALYYFLLFSGSLAFVLFSAARKRLIAECSYGDLAATGVIKNRRNYKAAKKIFDQIPKDAWDQRYFYSVAFSRSLSRKVLEKWTDKEPQSADAWLVYGAFLVIWSWSIRGYGRGHDVSQEKWAKFYKALEFTDGVLHKAAVMNPEDPTPWAYLIMIETWASGDYDTKLKYFNNAIARDPENWIAHIHMIIALSKKWGAHDHDDMVEFAKDAAKNARAGSDIPIVLIKAYLELYKYETQFEGDEAAALEILNDEEIEKESLAAYSKSLGHPQHVETKTTIFAHYNFSGWMWALDNKELLKKEFEIMGDAICSTHWLWVGFEEDLDQAKEYAYS